MQQFVLSEGGCFWDLSPDNFVERVKQVSGDFLGWIFGHTTSQSMWERVLNSYVTTLFPDDGSLLVWESDLKRKKSFKNKNVIEYGVAKTVL